MFTDKQVCPFHIETSQLLWNISQWPGFYMKGTLTIKELRDQYVTSMYVPFIQKPVHCFAVQTNDSFPYEWNTSG